MKKILLTIAFASIVLGVVAQQNFQVSQYYRASNIINPALSGVNKMTEVNVGFRKQWAGIEGSPRTFYINGHKGIQKSETSKSVSMPMRMSHAEDGKQISKEDTKIGLKQGIGGYAYSDKTGQLSRTSLGGSYAAHLDLNDDIKASVGASLGLTSFALDQVTVQESDDAFFNSLNASNNRRMSLDVNLGFLLYSKNWYFGYSGMQFLGNKIFDLDANPDGKLYLHHNILAGYKYEIDKNMYILANVLVKTVKSAPASFDINAKVVKDNKYWGGLGVRNGDALIVFLGGQLTDNLNLNYSYDFNTRLSKYSSGGHEIVLGINLGDLNSKDRYNW